MLFCIYYLILKEIQPSNNAVTCETDFTKISQKNPVEVDTV